MSPDAVVNGPVPTSSARPGVFSQPLSTSPPLSQPGGLVVVLDGLPADLPDGEVRASTPDGKTYYGEIHDGLPEGRGLVMMPDGARYEGSLVHGEASGAGVYLLPGGVAFYGNWSQGRLHGEVVHTFPKMTAISICFYDHGSLQREEVLEVGDKRLKPSRRARKRAKEQYRAPQPGEPVYRGHSSYDLVQQLQLGLTYSIAQSGTKLLGPGSNASTSLNAIGMQSGMEVRKQNIPATGTVPAFQWKEYLPTTFQKLREMFDIDNGDFLLSMTGDEALRVVPSTGKSGSIFVLSGDDRFMAKTVRKEEMRIILQLIPEYYRHCTRNRSTLLVRFYGIYRVSPLLGRRVRFLLMQNALPQHLRLHRKYDLKGSRHGRTAGVKRDTKPFTTLKDLDVDCMFILPAAAHAAVLRQVERDCQLFERLNVMDYSLLLGVHFVEWGNDTWRPPFGDWGALPGQGDGHDDTSATGASPRASSLTASFGARSEDPGVNQATTPGTPLEASHAGGGRVCKRPSNAGAAAVAGLLRSWTRSENELDEIVRSAASMVAHAGHSSAAAWRSAVRMDEPLGGAGGTRIPAGGEAVVGTEIVQRALSRQLSLVEERTAPLRDTRPLHTWLWGGEGDPAAAGRGSSDGSTSAPLAACESIPGKAATPSVSVSFGTAVPALAVQTAGLGSESAVPQPVLLYFAIIDFLQDYNVRKMLEHAFKAPFQGRDEVSVLNAGAYSRRFQAMIRELFVAGPSTPIPDSI